MLAAAVVDVGGRGIDLAVALEHDAGQVVEVDELAGNTSIFGGGDLLVRLSVLLGRVAGHSVGELHRRRPGRGVHSHEQALVLVRERGQAMAKAAAITETGMFAILGGAEEDVLAAIDRHGLTPPTSTAPGRSWPVARWSSWRPSGPSRPRGPG